MVVISDRSDYAKKAFGVSKTINFEKFYFFPFKVAKAFFIKSNRPEIAINRLRIGNYTIYVGPGKICQKLKSLERLWLVVIWPFSCNPVYRAAFTLWPKLPARGCYSGEIFIEKPIWPHSVYHESIYGEADNLTKMMIDVVKKNFRKCLQQSDEVSCLQWLYGSDFFWSK